MPKLICIHGPIASGKSTLSRQLLKKLDNFVFVDRAQIKDMLKKIGKKDSKKIADLTSLFMISEIVKLKKDILIQEMGLEKIKNNLSLKNYDCYSFYLKCSLSFGIKRDKLRYKKSGDENKIKENYKRIKSSKGDIILNTEKNSVKDCVDFILKKIY